MELTLSTEYEEIVQALKEVANPREEKEGCYG